MLHIKRDINQKDFKIVDIYFIKFETQLQVCELKKIVVKR